MAISKNNNQVFKNEYIFSLITRVLAIIISIVHSILIARYLGSELLGTNSYINSVASLIAIIVTFGVHQAYPFYKRKKKKDEFYNNYISFVVILFLLYFAICVVLSTFSSSLQMAAILLLFPLMGYSNVVDYISLIDAPKKENFINLIISFIDILLIVFLWLFIQKSFWVAFLILSFSYLVKAVIFSILAKVKIKPQKDFFKFSFEIIKFGFFPMLALVMTTLNYRLDVIMLKQYDFITLSMVGVYSLGINIADKLVLIPDTLKGVLVSHLSKGAGEEEVAKISRLSFVSSILISILILACGSFLINLVYGPEYNGAYEIIIISTLGTVFIGFFKLIAQYNIVNKRQHINTLMLLVSIVVNIVCNLIFIPIFGINGAALATGLGHFACGATFVIWFCIFTKTPIENMFIVKKTDLIFIKRLFHRSNIND